MDQHQMLWSEKVATSIISYLEKRRIEGSYAANSTQARNEVLGMIPPGSTVYRAGSMTTTALGLWEGLAALPGVTVIDPYLPGIPTEESMEMRRRGLTADVMIASVNAITLDGKLVNLDGMGNRVAAMIFGPKKVILVVGVNKIVPDLESAMSRIKHYAAPINSIRIGYQNPCVETGLCADCRSPQRICNIWSIIEGQMVKGRIHVKLVGENLGY